MSRVYLDHNATMALRPEARAAMISAMDLVGNPSSVHAEGRAAKAVIETARGQILEALGAEGMDLVFTSGASEAAALALAGRGLHAGAVEHDAVMAWSEDRLTVSRTGAVEVVDPGASTLQLANSETGVVQDLPKGLAVSDMTQAVGRIAVDIAASGVAMALVSAHKFGGPKGIGALILRRGIEIPAQMRGGGQEMGRRSGTENVVAIAGFAAALGAAKCDLEAGNWQKIEKIRDDMEAAIASCAKETIFVGKDSASAGARPGRLPNTSCIAVPGWKGETQVMQMDLAGFAISAGSACSSGKVRASRVLRAMGYDEATAAGAIRISLGLTTTAAEVAEFVRAWAGNYEKHRARAA